VLVAPPLFHGFGLGVSAIAHSVGASVVISRRFDAEQTLALIERYRVSCMVGVPVMLQRILALSEQQRARYDTSTLCAVLSAGAPLPPSLATRFMDAYGPILHNAYGSTETGFGAIAGPGDLRRAPGTIGRAALGAAVRVLDAERRPTAPGETGHIFVGGDLVFDGYGDGSSKELSDGLMNTGDLGHVDAQGCFHVEGREDDMIVSGGENVFPQEVEHALAAHAGVLDVAIVGAQDADFGQRLVAYVVTSPERPVTAEELGAHLRSRLERYKLPREIVFRDEIPRTPTGKVLRRELE
jgi:fatty-acyl-CoA synthase